jgi:biopolymer transport protein ExbB
VKGFNLDAMLLQGWPVLSILLLMSVVSCTVILDRFLALMRRRMDVSRFVEEVCRIVRDESPAAAGRFCRKYNWPVAVVAGAVLAQEGSRSSMERALRYALQQQIRDMEMYVPILGTVASLAPFVGLFGTVIGIIRAFADISQNVGGGPDVVAAGIAEALVTTAGGLLVAIPALAAYNFFVRRIQRATEEIDLAAYPLIELLCNERGQVR